MKKIGKGAGKKSCVAVGIQESRARTRGGESDGIGAYDVGSGRWSRGNERAWRIQRGRDNNDSAPLWGK